MIKINEFNLKIVNKIYNNTSINICVLQITGL